MYNPHPKRKLLADMDKTQLLNMRDEGLSNEEIALRVGCSYQTIYRAIGKQPDHITVRRKSEGHVMIAGTAKTSEGGYTVERKAPSFMPQREEESVKAVLVVKKAPIRLHGACFDYTLDEKTVEVETEEGRVLLSMETDKLGTFIEELQAIRKNMSVAQAAPFWGVRAMTSREEIERLLNQTGRTLKWLPEDYGDKKLELWNSFRDKTFGYIKSFNMANRILHQSDVIELLVGALRDALDKPMQKPLTLEEVVIYADPVWLEFRLPGGHGWYLGIGLATRAAERWYRHYQLSTCVYGKDYRFWRQRPTDEEREAAAWES